MTRIELSAVAMIGLVTGSVGATDLTIERIFADPGLSGPSLRLLKVAPDGRRVTYVQGREDDQYQFDLWEYNVDAGERRLLVDSLLLSPGEEVLSDEERARRERQRVSSLKGIVEYFFSDDGEALLFPLNGDLYLYDLGRPAGEATRRLTNDAAAEIDPQFSPDRRFVSFVRDQDLYAIELTNGKVRRLTRDGGGTTKNGLAEFIAQEEMGRNSGYWWSPDERHVAFMQVDESPVDEAERFEVYADEFRVYRQRYPWTGTPNVTVRLGVVESGSGNASWMDLGDDSDIYVPRVDWFPDGKHLLVQRQSRDQQRLDMLKVAVATGESELLFSETSDTWITLHDDLYFLESEEVFIWASDRSGYKHLYLYGNDGRLIRPLTAGEWTVNGNGSGKALLAVDEKAGQVYFVATKASPLERQIYRTSLKTETPEKVTRISKEQGWHIVAASDNAAIYVDTFSSPSRPPGVSVHRMDGTRLGFLLENPLDEGHPYHPYLARHSRPEFGTIDAADGQAMHYRLIRPADFDPERRYPVVVDVYGGPHGQRVKRIWAGFPRTSDGMWRQLLAQRGYVVFSLDNRGTSFRGTAFDAPIHRNLGRLEVEDQVAGVEFLRTLSFVDPERIGVFGWSYGGYMALMCMMQAPDYFAAGVSGAPVTDWRLYDTHYTERYLGHPEKYPEAYRSSNVLEYIRGLSGPLLVIHGMADDNVLLSHSTLLFDALQKQGTTFDVMLYPGSKHGLLRHRTTGIHGYRTILGFLDRHLQEIAND